MSVSYSGMGSNMDNTINPGNANVTSMGFTVRYFLVILTPQYLRG
jgi:hypothetical protein